MGVYLLMCITVLVTPAQALKDSAKDTSTSNGSSENKLDALSTLLIESYTTGTDVSPAPTDKRGIASECFECENAETNGECQRSGRIQQCPQGDLGGCQTIVQNENGVLRITKKCKAVSVCRQEEETSVSRCNGYDTPQSVCYFCCECDRCNWGLNTSTCGGPPSSYPPDNTKSQAEDKSTLFEIFNSTRPDTLSSWTSENTDVYNKTNVNDTSSEPADNVTNRRDTTLSSVLTSPMTRYGEASECYRCENAQSNDECLQSGSIQKCPEGDYGGCQTEVRNDNGVLRITKKCKAVSVCRQEEELHKPECKGYDAPGSVCYFCCECDRCNWGLNTSTCGGPPSSYPPDNTTSQLEKNISLSTGIFSNGMMSGSTITSGDLTGSTDIFQSYGVSEISTISETSSVNDLSTISETSTPHGTSFISEQSTILETSTPHGTSSVSEQSTISETSTPLGTSSVSEQSTISETSTQLGTSSVSEQSTISETSIQIGTSSVSEQSTISKTSTQLGTSSVSEQSTISETSTQLRTSSVSEQSTISKTSTQLRTSSVSEQSTISEASTQLGTSSVSEQSTISETSTQLGTSSVSEQSTISKTSTQLGTSCVSEQSTISKTSTQLGTSSISEQSTISETSTQLGTSSVSEQSTISEESTQLGTSPVSEQSTISERSTQLATSSVSEQSTISKTSTQFGTSSVIEQSTMSKTSTQLGTSSVIEQSTISKTSTQVGTSAGLDKSTSSKNVYTSETTTPADVTMPSGGASQCYRCENAQTNIECQQTGSIQQCPEGDFGACQTEVRNTNGILTINKKCKAVNVCRLEEETNRPHCKGYNTPGSICYFCCQCDLCNWGLNTSICDVKFTYTETLVGVAQSSFLKKPLAVLLFVSILHLLSI